MDCGLWKFEVDCELLKFEVDYGIGHVERGDGWAGWGDILMK